MAKRRPRVRPISRSALVGAVSSDSPIEARHDRPSARAAAPGDDVPPLSRRGRSCLCLESDHERTRDTASGMAFVPPDRHLLRAKDLADARYADPISVEEMAQAAGLSRAHFSRAFKRAFGESPRAYLLTRRLERAAALLRMTDRSVARICLDVGLQSLGSFTTTFTRTYGMSPT